MKIKENMFCFFFDPNLFSVFRVFRGQSFMFLVGVCFFVGCSKSPTSPKNNRPQIEVQSPITQNTIWESGNDYIVRGQVTVEENALLTIRFDVHEILIEDSESNKGKLYIEGGIFMDRLDLKIGV